MKSLKIFILTGFVLLLLAAGAAGYVWFKVQNALSVVGQQAQQEVKVQQQPEEVVEFTPSPETPLANSVPEEGIHIDTSTVPDEQKAVAQKVGIDLEGITLTAEMISCAELELGTLRIQEIVEGSKPTVGEGLTLLGCL